MKRRTFLKAAASGALAFAVEAAAATDWKRQPGLELYTVRDLLEKDFEGTIAKVAEIGYKEVEPTGYGGLEPKQFRALLDRYGITAPSTHAGATEGPDLEKQLQGFQVMGIKYTEIRGGGGGQGGGRGAPTADSVKRTAQQINRHGEIARKFGMKMLIHNHTQEFEPIEGTTLRPYDILLTETDPALVAMQLDIGWASVAGQNVLEMFKKNPGRYELWHVKDATGLKNMDPKLSPNDRRKASKLVPVGEGDIDYKSIFANAQTAGLKHYCVEQDNAAEGGDSIAAARTSYRNLMRILS
jgi:sugar phosphate isomerase/epimerase